MKLWSAGRLKYIQRLYTCYGRRTTFCLNHLVLYKGNNKTLLLSCIGIPKYKMEEIYFLTRINCSLLYVMVDDQYQNPFLNNNYD